MSKKTATHLLAKKLDSKFPQYLIHILERSGFDTEVSLTDLNENDIKEIESFVEKNKHILEGTPYEEKNPNSNNNNSFSFKPGHKKLIFSLSKVSGKQNAQLNKQLKARKEEKVKLQKDDET